MRTLRRSTRGSPLGAGAWSIAGACLWVTWHDRENRPGYGESDFLEGLGLSLAATPEEADFILVQGTGALYAGTETAVLECAGREHLVPPPEGGQEEENFKKKEREENSSRGLSFKKEEGSR